MSDDIKTLDRIDCDLFRLSDAALAIAERSKDKRWAELAALIARARTQSLSMLPEHIRKGLE